MFVEWFECVLFFEEKKNVSKKNLDGGIVYDFDVHVWCEVSEKFWHEKKKALGVIIVCIS